MLYSEIEHQSSVPNESQESLPKEDQLGSLIEGHSNILSECVDLGEDHKGSSSLSSSWDVKEETQHIVISQDPLPEMIESLQLPCKPPCDKGKDEEHTKKLIIMEK